MQVTICDSAVVSKRLFRAYSVESANQDEYCSALFDPLENEVHNCRTACHCRAT